MKYEGKDHADHLIAALKDNHTIENDWERKLYCGIELDWHCEEGWVDTSMQTYMNNQQTWYGHPQPKRLQRTLYAPAPVVFGRAAQDLP